MCPLNTFDRSGYLLIADDVINCMSVCVCVCALCTGVWVRTYVVNDWCVCKNTSFVWPHDKQEQLYCVISDSADSIAVQTPDDSTTLKVSQLQQPPPWSG